MSHPQRWFELTKCDECLVVTYRGDHRYWHGHAPEKEQILQELLPLPTAPQDRIVLDLRRVPYISGDGMGILARFLKKVMESKCRVAVVCQPEVQEVLQITKIDKVLQLRDSVTSAVTDLKRMADVPIIVLAEKTGES